MGKIFQNAEELVGKTPLMELVNIEKQLGLKAKILAKLEYFNPAGSVKDRVAVAIIDEAEKSGKIKKGSTIIEPTSGNTGIGLAMAAAIRGYRIILTMPETMSIERRNILKAYGASIVLTPGDKGMEGAIEKAEKLHEEIEGSFIAGQFTNPVNVEAHYRGTGPEIFADTEGRVDLFVSTVGTGGTVTGTGKYLKEKSPDVEIVAVEPAASAVMSGGKPGSHNIQGIGAGFIPVIMDMDLLDEIISIDDEDAFAAARACAKTEGILIGISSGAALVAAIKLAQREENKNKNIVVLFPDGGDRYYSTPLFQSEEDE